MSGAIIGVIIGLYTGNPQFRATIDAQIKRAVGVGIDYLNAGGNGAIIDAPQETKEDE